MTTAVYVVHTHVRNGGDSWYCRTVRNEFSQRPSRTTKLQCKSCKAEILTVDCASKVRRITLLGILQQTDAWRCTCKKTPQRQKAEYALNKQIHFEKFQLHPTALGNKRWDGKIKGITWEDLQFLREMNLLRAWLLFQFAAFFFFSKRGIMWDENVTRHALQPKENAWGSNLEQERIYFVPWKKNQARVSKIALKKNALLKGRYCAARTCYVEL